MAVAGQMLGTFVIIGDGDGGADQLCSLARKEGMQGVSLCICAAPPRYEVAKEADVTVVIYNPGRPGRQAVVANFALHKDGLEETKRDAIIAVLANVLPR